MAQAPSQNCPEPPPQVAPVEAKTAVPAAAQVCPNTPPGVIRLATGPKQGTYYKIGAFLQKEVATGEYSRNQMSEISLLPSNGSDNNVELIRSCAADVAFIQSDVYHEAINGHGYDTFKEPVRVLSKERYAIYSEYAQILVPPHSTVHGVADLRGRRVLIGPPCSGTAHTALTILRTANVKEEQFTPIYSDDGQEPDKLVRGFRNNLYEAAFLIGPLPHQTVKALVSRDPEYRLVSLDNDLIRELIGAGAFVAASIPSDEYWSSYSGYKWYTHASHDEPAAPEDVSTVAVEAFLVSRQGPRYERAAETLSGILQEHWRDMARASVTLDLMQPLITRRRLVVLLLCLLPAYLGLRLAYRRYGRTVRMHQEMLVVTISFMSMWLLASAGLYAFEHRYNPYFVTFWKSSRSTVSYVAGRFEGRTPMTSRGELLALLSVIFGLGVVAWFTAELSTRLISGEMGALSRMLERRKSMLAKITGHTVLVNWDERGPDIARQILHKHRIPSRPSVVVLTATEVVLPNGLSEDLIVVVGNATDTDTLGKARVPYARSVVILSSWKRSDPQERRKLDADSADSRTMMSIMAIRSLRAVGPPVPVIAEIKNKTNVAAALHCSGAEDHTELVCVDDFGADVLGCAAVTPGLARLFGELVRAKNGTGISNKRVPAALVGHSFSDVLRWTADSPNSNQGIEVPIGICREGAILMTPSDAAVGALKDSDQLVVIYGSRGSLVGISNVA